MIWLKKKWQRKILTLLWPFRFIGARLTKFPPVGRLVKHFFFDGDFAVYLPHKKAQKGQVKVVLPDAVVNYFIEQASFRFQMNGCVCRETNRCQNYPPDLGCLFLGEAARGINPALGREVGVAEAKAIQKRVDELGLINMVGKLRLDRVLLAVSPGERLLTICHCCECCCLFNLLPYLATPIGRSIQKLDGLRSGGRALPRLADASKPALPGLSALKESRHRRDNAGAAAVVLPPARLKRSLLSSRRMTLSKSLFSVSAAM